MAFLRTIKTSLIEIIWFFTYDYFARIIKSAVIISWSMIVIIKINFNKIFDNFISDRLERTESRRQNLNQQKYGPLFQIMENYKSFHIE